MSNPNDTQSFDRKMVESDKRMCRSFVWAIGTFSITGCWMKRKIRLSTLTESVLTFLRRNAPGGATKTNKWEIWLEVVKFLNRNFVSLAVHIVQKAELRSSFCRSPPLLAFLFDFHRNEVTALLNPWPAVAKGTKHLAVCFFFRHLPFGAPVMHHEEMTSCVKLWRRWHWLFFSGGQSEALTQYLDIEKIHPFSLYMELRVK